MLVHNSKGILERIVANSADQTRLHLKKARSKAAPKESKGRNQRFQIQKFPMKDNYISSFRPFRISFSLAIVCRRLQSNITKLRLQRQ
jgi:hypothetical protein